MTKALTLLFLVILTAGVFCLAKYDRVRTLESAIENGVPISGQVLEKQTSARVAKGRRVKFLKIRLSDQREVSTAVSSKLFGSYNKGDEVTVYEDNGQFFIEGTKPGN